MVHQRFKNMVIGVVFPNPWSQWQLITQNHRYLGSLTGVLACWIGKPSGFDPWHEACDVCTPHFLPVGHSHPSFWGRGPSWADEGRQGKSWVWVGITGCGSIPCTPVMATLVCPLLGCSSILPAATTTHRRCPMTSHRILVMRISK